MIKLLFIALGGAVGSLSRYGVGRLALAQMPAAMNFPVGTLIVNIIGSFLIGLCVHVIPRDHDLGLLIVTGFLGGFTTFSAFSVETMALLKSGQTAQAFVYIGLSVGVSLLAVFLGSQVGAHV